MTNLNKTEIKNVNKYIEGIKALFSMYPETHSNDIYTTPQEVKLLESHMTNFAYSRDYAFNTLEENREDERTGAIYPSARKQAEFYEHQISRGTTQNDIELKSEMAQYKVMYLERQHSIAVETISQWNELYRDLTGKYFTPTVKSKQKKSFIDTVRQSEKLSQQASKIIKGQSATDGQVDAIISEIETDVVEQAKEQSIKQ